MARRYCARSAWVRRGHGPRSKACRAAATARATSSLEAAPTRTHTSSVAGWTTSMRSPLLGVTHSPPIYKRSGYLTGTAYALSTVIDSVFLLSVDPAAKSRVGRESLSPVDHQL